jgi:hypothetical protein
MRWTRLLAFVSAALIAVLVAGSLLELLRSTFAVGDDVLASVVTLAVVLLAVAATVGVGARSRRWLSNPDAYW